jgi:hypothetical protein
VPSKRQTINCKELHTILETLQFEANQKVNRVRGRLVYFFSDNLVTYDVLRKGLSKSIALQKLVLYIKALEIELGCGLKVIHIPGMVMIHQGTDCHSRGVWTAPLNNMTQLPTISVFTPASNSPGLLQWTLS